jgi:hypothetical protein
MDVRESCSPQVIEAMSGTRASVFHNAHHAGRDNTPDGPGLASQARSPAVAPTIHRHLASSK